MVTALPQNAPLFVLTKTNEIGQVVGWLWREDGGGGGRFEPLVIAIGLPQQGDILPAGVPGVAPISEIVGYWMEFRAAKLAVEQIASAQMRMENAQ